MWAIHVNEFGEFESFRVGEGLGEKIPIFTLSLLFFGKEFLSAFFFFCYSRQFSKTSLLHIFLPSFTL